MTAEREDSTALRAQLVDISRRLRTSGNVNTSGNVSARCVRGRRDGFLLTPSGLPYDALAPEDIVFVDGDGNCTGRHAPSTEWRFHASIYKERADLDAIVHTHSPHATALACHHLPIPAFHYMVSVAGGTDIRCADYATFGSQALADNAVHALQGRRACLLAHHGVIACGADLEAAFALALEVENLARVYILARTLGEPPLLNATQMAQVVEKFEHYGRK